MYDIQTKKRLFCSKDAHSAPIRDIAMSASAPEVFMTCSFDCNLNVYDLRKRSIVQQAKHSKPLSSAALSPCGNFCVAGNLKGDLISYDFRNLKTELASKRAHDSAVVRVAFIPPVNEANALDKFGESINVTSSSMATPLPQPLPNHGESAESFNQFVEMFKAKNIDDMSSPGRKRDSMFDIVGAHNLHDFSTDSAMSPSRLSLGLDSSELRLKKMTPRISINSSLFRDIPSSAKPENPVPVTVPKKTEEIVSKLHQPPAAKRSRRTESAELSEIEEEDNKSDAENENEFERSKLKSPEPSNKENRQSNQQEIESFTKFIKNTHVSTPNSAQIKLPKTEPERVSVDGLSELLDRKLSLFSKRLDDAKEEILSRVHAAENEIKFFQDHYYHQSFLASFNMFRSNQKETDAIKEGIAMMLRSDEFIEEFYRLREENDQLKAQLNASK